MSIHSKNKKYFEITKFNTDMIYFTVYRMAIFLDTSRIEI